MLENNFKCNQCNYTTYLVKAAVNLKIPECPLCGGLLKEFSGFVGGAIDLPDLKNPKEGDKNENNLKENESKE